MIKLHHLYTTEEIALYGRAKLEKQWHMIDLLDQIAEAEEWLNWEQAERLRKQYNELAEQENK